MDKVLCSPYLLSRFNSYNPLKSDNCRSFSDKVVCFGTKHNHFSCSSVSSLQKDNNVSWLRHLCPQITKIKPWNDLNRRNQSWWHGHLFHWGEILGRCSCPFLQRARSVRVEWGYRVSWPRSHHCLGPGNWFSRTGLQKEMRHLPMRTMEALTVLVKRQEL